MSVEEMLDNLVAYLRTQPVEARPPLVQEVMHSLTKHKNPLTDFVAQTLEEKLIESGIIEKIK